MTSHVAVDTRCQLAELRLAAGMSREQLGAAAGGTSSATIYRIERGRVRPHRSTLAALARALGCSPADLQNDASRAGNGLTRRRTMRTCNTQTSARSGARTHAARQLDAGRALVAVLADRGSYRLDPSGPTDAWDATCPSCYAPWALRITERRDPTYDDPHPPVKVGCRRRCAEPRQLERLLCVDPDLIAARADARRWRQFAERVSDRFRRALELDQAGDEMAVAA